VIPTLAEPVASYINYRRSGNLLFLSGVGPTKEGKVQYAGKVGREVSLEDAYQAARLCALNHLAQIKSAVGEFDSIAQVVFLQGFINCAPGFTDSPAVLNGASDLLIAVFEDRGRHSRAAVGVAELWKNIPVETVLTVELYGYRIEESANLRLPRKYSRHGNGDL
jgi:enamine deaminase RidA (YjgF/YER057c/UK114 family)